MQAQDTPVRVQLGGRRGPVKGFALVDRIDAPSVLARNWYLDSMGYARSDCPNPGTRLHRFLLQPLPGFEVDHINGDKLDNRRDNLRVVTRSGQCQNMPSRSRTGFRNVYYDDRRRSFYAQVKVNGKRHTRHGFQTADLAAVAAAELRAAYLPYAVEGR